MVPVRAVSEALGYEVGFGQDDLTVHLSKGEVNLELYPDETKISMTIGDSVQKMKTIDTAPYIKNGRTFVPLRFISEEFGLDVQWNQSNQTVILRGKE
jgi:hypothetical protein